MLTHAEQAPPKHQRPQKGGAYCATMSAAQTSVANPYKGTSYHAPHKCHNQQGSFAPAVLLGITSPNMQNPTWSSKQANMDMSTTRHMRLLQEPEKRVNEFTPCQLSFTDYHQ